MSFDYDFIIVGSGFGGSVSALRLAEKGYSVCVIERGKRLTESDFPKTNWNVRRYLWAPLFKCFGIQKLTLFRHILILSGTGVGGGSLVYANTLLEPGKEFYESPVWSHLGDWKTELAPHYQTAKKMMGVRTNPKLTFVDDILKECAKEAGQEATFKPSEVAIYFGEPGKKVPDPYFGGQGPSRNGCIYCGGCMVGCRFNAKNSLPKNYLYFAEKLGVQILPERKVTAVTPLAEGYRVDTECSTAWFKKSPKSLTARKVILAGGVLGTLDLLLKCKEVKKTLPKISNHLGHNIRTNSEALVGITQTSPLKGRNFSEGIAISSIYHADRDTHIEPVRYSEGSTFMRLLSAPMVDGGGGVPRVLRLVGSVLRHPIDFLRFQILTTQWSRRSIILLVMQTLDNRMRFKLGRSIINLFRKSLITVPEGGQLKIPSYIPVANQVARAFARIVGGVPQSAVNEVVLDIPTTAHILGGCNISDSPSSGVIGLDHQVFGYPGIYVCDGSVIPANLGVNPSLTIMALTERAMSRIPTKEGAVLKSLVSV